VTRQTQYSVYVDAMGTVVILALGVIAAVVGFVSLAMDAGRYQWATELIGRTFDRMLRRIRTLVHRRR
jgi:hypothetical protein